MLCRPLRLDDDLSRPILVDDLDSARSESTCSSCVANDLARNEAERAAVDVARDEIPALRRRQADLVLAERHGLAHCAGVGGKRQVCTT